MIIRYLDPGGFGHISESFHYMGEAFRQWCLGHGRPANHQTLVTPRRSLKGTIRLQIP